MGYVGGCGGAGDGAEFEVSDSILEEGGQDGACCVFEAGEVIAELVDEF